MIAYRLNTPAQITRTNEALWSRLKNRYINYCESQKEMKVYWYMKAIILLTCVYMVPSIMVMALATDYYVYYIGFTILLFYANVLVHIMQVKSIYYISLYHFTCLLMILLPLASILIFGTQGTLITF